MEITLLTMDVAAASPGTTSASNSQPGDNAPTFAQLWALNLKMHRVIKDS